MAAAGAAADQGVRAGFEVIVVVGQAGDVDQSLDRQLAEPAEEPEILDSDDDGVEGLADLVFQVGQQFHPDQLALGGLGASLGARAVLGEHDQLVMTAARLFPLEPGDQLAMDLQVGIAADRRGEVAVVLAGQRVVPLGLGRVGGLFQAAKQAVVDGVFLGPADRLLRAPAGARTGSGAGR